MDLSPPPGRRTSGDSADGPVIDVPDATCLAQVVDSRFPPVRQLRQVHMPQACLGPDSATLLSWIMKGQQNYASDGRPIAVSRRSVPSPRRDVTETSHLRQDVPRSLSAATEATLTNSAVGPYDPPPDSARTLRRLDVQPIPAPAASETRHARQQVCPHTDAISDDGLPWGEPADRPADRLTWPPRPRLKSPALLDAAGPVGGTGPQGVLDHTEYLVARFQLEASAREPHVGEARVRAAHFPTAKILEVIDVIHLRGPLRQVAYQGGLDFIAGQPNP